MLYRIMLFVLANVESDKWRIQDFPLGGGGVRSHWGAPTSDMGTFRQKHVQKRKNWIPLGAPPWIRQW